MAVILQVGNFNSKPSFHTLLYDFLTLSDRVVKLVNSAEFHEFNKHSEKTGCTSF